MQEPIKLDISKVESITIENGVLVITPKKEEETKPKLPEVGYWTGGRSQVAMSKMSETSVWSELPHRNIYPRENHAILTGQVLAPLLVKHWELTGGYWAERAAYIVRYSHVDYKWSISGSASGIKVNPLSFPFKDSALAHRFIEENKDALNELARLWQEG